MILYLNKSHIKTGPLNTVLWLLTTPRQYYNTPAQGSGGPPKLRLNSWSCLNGVLIETLVSGAGLPRAKALVPALGEVPSLPLYTTSGSGGKGKRGNVGSEVEGEVFI